MKKALTYCLVLLILISLLGCTRHIDNDDPVILYNSDSTTLNESNPQKSNASVGSGETEIKENNDLTDETLKSDVTADKQNEDLSEQVSGSKKDTDDIEPVVIEKEDVSEIEYDRYSSDDAYKVLPGGIYSLRSSTSDTFLCKILKATPINESLSFPNFSGFADNNVIYTVQIEKVYRSTFTEEATIVHVVSRANDEKKWWVLPYETGERYIITGIVQPYKKVPILVDSMSLSAHVADDGSLTPQSYSSKHTLANIKSLNLFENNSEAQKLFAYKYDLLANIADDYAQTRLDSVSPEHGTTLVAGDKQIEVKSDDEVIEYIKNALIINTDVKSDIEK